MLFIVFPAHIFDQYARNDGICHPERVADESKDPFTPLFFTNT
jgi:hypothetical protein